MKKPSKATISVSEVAVFLHIEGKDYEIEPVEAKRLGEGLFKSGCQVQLKQQGK